ncbi:MAG TPA: 4-hydroxybenzoate octaprenyltransferase [Nitrospiria bacterium]|nr:4-hydroxybenzoate octaprenyltransferase [Nitrospiria bacterium]
MIRAADKLIALTELIRLEKPYGALLLLWPSLWALTIASEGRPTVRLVVLFCLGAWIMRSVGCAMNDLADRDIDCRVARTKHRPLPSGRLTPFDAIVTILALLLIAAWIVWQLPPMTRWLSLPGVLLAAGYPLTKRFFPAPQFVMGVAFGWGVPMAWSAVRSEIDPTAWLLFAATVCWAAAYDTIYAMMDETEDARLGVHSTARLFGHFSWLAVVGLELVMLALLVWVGRRAGLHAIYFSALAAVCLLFLYQSSRVRMHPDRETAFRLFRAHVGVGLIVLLGIELDYALALMVFR